MLLPLLLPSALAGSVLLYGPTAFVEEALLTEDGHQVTVWDEEQWRAASTEDFAAFDAIVVGEKSCAGPDIEDFDALYDTRETWAAAMDGNIIVTGTDAGCHAGDDLEAPTRLLLNMIGWAADGGVLGGYFSSEWGKRELDYLEALGDFSSSQEYGDTILILDPTHPAFAGLTEDDLDDWGSSQHTRIDSYGERFIPIATDALDEPIVVSSGSCDSDGDGVAGVICEGEDCDDWNASISPEADEVWYDGIDQDCAGGDDYDADGDGWQAADWGGEDCLDNDPSAFPGAEEVPDDGIDQDCDGSDLVTQTDAAPAGDMGGCGCGGGTGGAGLAWLAAALLGVRRRR